MGQILGQCHFVGEVAVLPIGCATPTADALIWMEAEIVVLYVFVAK